MAPSQPTVLLLEDDTATRELYRRALSRLFRIVTCGSEQEATAQLAAAKIDVLVLEPAALESELHWFIAMLRSHYPQLPVVVCSILDVRGDSARLAAGAYLLKPVTPALLAGTLSTVLASPKVA